MLKKTTWHGVVAMDEMGAIGMNEKLPWHLPLELAHFKNLTINQTICLGNKTYRSFKGPLPNRIHFVLSRSDNVGFEDRDYGREKKIIYFSRLDHLIDKAESQFENIFVCGGATIYAQLMPYISIWHRTTVHTKINGATTFFPKMNWTKWKVVEKKLVKEDSIPWTYEKLERINPLQFGS